MLDNFVTTGWISEIGLLCESSIKIFDQIFYARGRDLIMVDAAAMTTDHRPLCIAAGKFEPLPLCSCYSGDSTLVL